MDTPFILVINDTPSVLMLFRALLEDAGYRVESAKIVVALEHIHRLNPDLLIIDIMMGQGREGLLFIHELKTQPDLATLPIICSTDSIDELQGYEEYLQRNRITILEKPINVNDFLAVVNARLREAGEEAIPLQYDSENG